jgi:DNA recombination protein RmuC
MEQALLLGISGLSLAAAVFFWRKNEALRTQLSASELARNMAEQTAGFHEAQLENLRTDRERFMEFAKSAAFETGQQISSRLMEDHKREREHAQQHMEQFTKNTSESLMQRQSELAQTISVMRGEMGTSALQIGTLVRAMKHPIGAGAEAEIGFDNLLSSLGLTRGVDYDLQVHMKGDENALRPDAVIYLPNDQLLVIDCKASQHVYGLFEAEGTEAYDAVFKKLAASMRQHVQKLAAKSYVQHLQQQLSRSGKSASLLHMVMYIPNDEVIARLRKYDPEFIALARQLDVVLAGPDTLPSLFVFARTLIRERKQEENQRVIITKTQELMGDLATAFSHVHKLGSSIRGATEAFDKFAASVNARVLGKVRALASLGVEAAGGKTVQPLPRYTVISPEQAVEADDKVLPMDVSSRA